MITNKDIRVENGNLVLNGDKFPLDGQSPETIMEIVEDNSDSTPTENSDAPITSGGVYTALGAKQDTLTFDSAPTDESTNPVTSGGVYTAIGAVDTKIGDLTQTGVTGADVAAQLADIEGRTLKVANVTAVMTVSTADPDAIGGYRSVSQTSKVLSTFTGYPTGKTVVADSLHAYGANAAIAAVVNVINGVVYLNAAKTGDYTVEGVVFYHD